jgi:hypothetical protein
MSSMGSLEPLGRNGMDASHFEVEVRGELERSPGLLARPWIARAPTYKRKTRTLPLHALPGRSAMSAAKDIPYNIL